MRRRHPVTWTELRYVLAGPLIGQWFGWWAAFVLVLWLVR
jgi:hypothetical protein